MRENENFKFCYKQDYCSSSSLFDLPDQSGTARVHSYHFLCSISLYAATNNKFP